MPERRLSSAEMEAVIRRAVELQTSAAPTDEGIGETELIRIGGELGLPATYVQQAVAEVRSRGEPEAGVLTGTFGPARVGVSRVVNKSVDYTRSELERYFRECEHMIVQRRREGWAVFEPSPSWSAQMKRSFSDRPLIGAPLVEMSVEAAGDAKSYVTLVADLGRARAGFATGTVLGGGGGGAAVATALGIAVAPPAALLGVPVLFGTWWGMRAGYKSVAARTRLRIESVVDRLESGELLPPASSWRKKIQGLGF